MAQRGGPGDPAAGGTFSGGAAGGLLVEVSAAVPAAAELTPPAPEFTPPAPAVEISPPPVEVLTAEIPRVSPPLPSLATAVPAKADAASGGRTARRGSRAAGATTGTGRGAGEGREGTGLAGAGTGQGGGGLGFVPPQCRLRSKPPYPATARAQRLEGTVLLLVSLDARGRVTSVALQQTCGHGILDQAALKAVRSWIFEPARQNGAAIAAQVKIPVRFRFEQRAANRV